MAVDGGARGKVEDSFTNGTVSGSMSVATTGTKLTYTCPTGKVAEVTGITIVTSAGTFSTGQWQIFWNGNLICTLAAGAILDSLNQGFGIILSAGQTVTLFVATAQAAVTAQGTIFAQERFAE